MSKRKTGEPSTAKTPQVARRKKPIFNMPLAQTMTSRTSSVTNAFVNAVVPRVKPTPEEVLEAIGILGMTPEDVRCAYCGDVKTEWDHLRPLVLDQRPTGYISEIANLVPACNKCNSSKRNENWRDWMLSTVDLSPTARGIPDVAVRIERLEAFIRRFEPTFVNFEEVLGQDHYSGYWVLWRETIAKLKSCQAIANEFRDKAQASLNRGDG